MNFPADLKYTRSHEWVKYTTGDKAQVGLTDHAQDQLGGLVFLQLPAEGDAVTAGEALGEVESVKMVSDIVSPFTGSVAAVNESLPDNPGAINEDPYGSWLVEIGGISGTEELLDAIAYEAFCGEEG